MATFFATRNSYGNEYSVGFYNSWDVLAFSSRKARDTFVAKHSPRDMSVAPIARRAVTARIRGSYNAPRPFSDEYWGIDTMNDELITDIPGHIGMVAVCRPDDWYGNSPERLYPR